MIHQSFYQPEISDPGIEIDLMLVEPLPKRDSEPGIPGFPKYHMIKDIRDFLVPFGHQSLSWWLSV
jgi:hypothetical protein